MNKWILRLLAGVAVTSAAGSAVATQNPASPDEEAWQRAVSANTLEAYARFSMDFPQSKFASKAHLKLATAGSAGAVDGERVPLNQPANSSEPEFVPNSLMVV
jgi:hypothetical protein